MRGGLGREVRAGLRYLNWHPELIIRDQAVLWSINEVLRGLFAAQYPRREVPGLDITAPTEDWLGDLMSQAMIDSEAQQDEEDGGDGGMPVPMQTPRPQTQFFEAF